MQPTLQFDSSLHTQTPEESKTSEATNNFVKGETLDSYAFLCAELSCCGLTQYLEVLVRNGFDDWNTVLDIQEEDLEAMGFKLGHRRKLQRHITNHSSPTIPAQSPTLFFDNDLTKAKCMDEARTLARVRKRSYNRRPKSDMNAPTKPKSGYVLYSNHIRKDPKVAVMSFDAIAKYVGHNWQLLGPKKRKLWEDRPTNEMCAYYNCLDIYKQSKNYAVYQIYLANFKKDGKHQSSMHKEKISLRKKESASSNKVRYCFLAVCLKFTMPTDK
jgi:hypothetical protein